MSKVLLIITGHVYIIRFAHAWKYKEVLDRLFTNVPWVTSYIRQYDKLARLITENEVLVMYQNVVHINVYEAISL